MKYDLLIKGGTAVMPDYGTARCDIGVRAGKIAAMADDIATSDASEVVDARGKYVWRRGFAFSRRHLSPASRRRRKRITLGNFLTGNPAKAADNDYTVGFYGVFGAALIALLAALVLTRLVPTRETVVPQ